VKARIWSSPNKAVICLALGLITLAVYAPSLTHSFLAFDDQQYVTENPRVQAGLTWSGVAWAARTHYASNWHPLTWLSHMLDCQLYGLKPAGHHLSNILLHTANTLLLFLVLSRMTGAGWRSACVAALFSWHPLHVESVAWVAERKDLLSTLFFLLTLGAYARYVEVLSLESKVQSPSSAECGVRSAENGVQNDADRSPLPAPHSTLHAPRSTLHVLLFYLLSLLCFALGLMSKPMVVTMPFLLLLVDYWPLSRFRFSGLRAQGRRLGFLLAEKIPFLVLSGVGCALTVAAQAGSFTIVSTDRLPLDRRIPHVLASYVHYLAATVAPRHLAAHYPYPATTPPIETASAALLLCLLTLLAIWLAARRPYVLVGWLWYVGTLVPVIGLVQVGDQAWADRYTYIPLIGIFIALVWGAADAFDTWCRFPVSEPGGRLQAQSASSVRMRRGAAVFLFVLGTGIGVALLVGTSLQLRYWKSTRTLFEHAAAVTQHNARALTLLGSLLAEEGKREEAARLFLRALNYSPENPETHFHLGKVLIEEGKVDEAIAHFSRSLWSKQWADRAHLQIGEALAKQQKYAEAIAHFQAALAANPHLAMAENNLARIFHSRGRLDEAIHHYQAALRLNPQLPQAHNNLGVVLLQKGRLAEGVVQLKEAVRLNPSNLALQLNLAQVLNQMEDWQQAAELFAQIAPARPNDAQLHFEFGLALAHLQKTREAMSHYARALRLQPDYPEALDRLAWIAATDPRPELRNGEEAVHMAERACELTGRKEARMVATLSAAYGETGRFAEGIQAAEEAKRLADTLGQQEVIVKCRGLMEALQSGKPWREAPSNPAVPSSSK
jgi:protein O-mannosyl-transferase